MQKLSKQALLAAMLLVFGATRAWAFCGFYVAKADAKLFNKSSQVIMVRDGEHTVITMSNDYQGDVKDFAMVVPVPEILQESDIRVVQHFVFDKLDAYTAPRLVEYTDPNPCVRYAYKELSAKGRAAVPSMATDSAVDEMEDGDLGVTIEATYTVGEYDILILSATESTGLKTWLVQNGYKIPSSANEVLQPYINDGMKFFVAKINLDAQAKTGMTTLRPLQIQFNSSRFMLPIRLGMANAETSEQDLIVYAFTRDGRVETANYRTTQLPTNRDVPEFIQTKNMFGEFYKDLYARAWDHEGKNSVMLEYAWDVSSKQAVKCDPCPTPPITFAELREAGVWWISPGSWGGGYVGDLFVTRLHARYSRATFPQDLMFTKTPNQTSFQGRYVIHHPATGDLSCKEGRNYKATLRLRKQRELQEMHALTGWGVHKYLWYMADGEEDVVPITTPEPVEKPEELIGSLKNGGSDNNTIVSDPKVQPVATPNLVEPAVSDVAETETDRKVYPEDLLSDEERLAESEAFLAVAKAEVGSPHGKTGWLFAVAMLMFAGGLAYRFRGKSGDEA